MFSSCRFVLRWRRSTKRKTDARCYSNLLWSCTPPMPLPCAFAPYMPLLAFDGRRRRAAAASYQRLYWHHTYTIDSGAHLQLNGVPQIQAFGRRRRRRGGKRQAGAPGGATIRSPAPVGRWSFGDMSTMDDSDMVPPGARACLTFFYGGDFASCARTTFYLQVFFITILCTCCILPT